MHVEYKVYLRDRESGCIGWYYHYAYTDDIEQSALDIMMFASDDDFECFKVVLTEILMYK